MIVSSRISGAIRSGYGTLIPSHSFPIAVLKINLDPDRVDANIHPTKREIRISDEPGFLRFVSTRVKETLQGQNLSHSGISIRSEFHLATDNQENPSQEPIYWISETPAQRVCEATLAGYRTTARQLRQTRLLIEPKGAEEESQFPPLNYIGQVAATYLLASNNSGDLILIDQHAAHERIRYDQLKREQREGTLSQELLVPIVLQLSTSEVHLLNEIKPDLEKEGFHLEPFGKDTWCVRSVPVVLGRCEDPDAIKEIISSVLGGGQENRMSESVSRLVACRGAVKAGVILTPEQGEEIISQLSRTSEPYTCPHGRPTIISFTRSKLEELFRRR